MNPNQNRNKGRRIFRQIHNQDARLVRKLRYLCGSLPGLSSDADIARLAMIYDRGGHHMLDSENVHRIVDAGLEHMRALRKLSHLLVMECKLNLTRHGGAPKQVDLITKPESNSVSTTKIDQPDK
jgi:hypothetical protein